MAKSALDNEELHRRIRIIGNKNRFRIIELTQGKPKSIIGISRELSIAYNKCADYVRMLEKEKLVRKSKSGRETLVKSKIRIGKMQVALKT